ncbi:hypothetical protein [Streptomyces anulatus]|uniref:hypothetical protein n=1 Tax=Streptomyces anulatus TaxID=1892 RepID=UPI0004C8F24F|nr:hypothetical protein [Streptomyces anulatus]
MILDPSVYVVVQTYVHAVDTALPGLVQGLYLVGSVALHDFHPGASDSARSYECTTAGWPGVVAVGVEVGCVDAGPQDPKRLAMNMRDVRRAQYTVHEYEFAVRAAVLVDHTHDLPTRSASIPWRRAAATA